MKPLLFLIVTLGGQHNKKVINPVLAGNDGRPMTSAYQTAEHDTLSQASGAYIGKHGKRPTRVSSAHSKTLKLGGTAKTYYPNGYYKRVGYQKSEISNAGSRVDALGQRVRDRFNE